jgi:hypothetical protein
MSFLFNPPKDCHLRVFKRIMRYLVLTHNLGIWYTKGSCFKLIRYLDADYARCKVDRKSTFETCQFLVQSLISWSSKKQNFIAPSMIEAEYVVTGSYCVQILWIQQTLKNYGYSMNHVPLLYDNESATKIAYNSCEHSRTKQIDIWYHFLRDHTIKEDIVVSHVETIDQLTHIFTKPLDEWRFCELRSELNIIDSRNVTYDIAHLIWWLLFLVELAFMSKKFYSCSNLFMFYDLIDLKPNIILIFKSCPSMSNICTIIGLYAKSFDNQFSRGFQVSSDPIWPDMSAPFAGHIRPNLSETSKSYFTR